MSEIKIGVLKSAYLLANSPYGEVSFKERTEKLFLSKKALWSLLRFHYGSQIDKEIKKLKDEKKDFDFNSFAIDKIGEIKTHKRFQYIIGLNPDDEEYVTAIASLKHSIKTEDMVYEIIDKTLKRKNYSLKIEKNLMGRIIYLKTLTPIIKIGVQIYAGDVWTYRAIKISPFAKITTCMNPLSWLGVKNVWFSKEKMPLFKIKRFEKVSYLEERIPEILDQSIELSENIGNALKRSENIDINEMEGKKILLALCKSYGIGLKPTKKIYERWIKEEKSNIYGLAMSASYFSVHENIFKKKSDKVFQNISSIAGALLLVRDKKETMRLVNEQFKQSEALQEELKEFD